MTKPYTEDDIAAALFAIAEGMSIRKACSEYGIPRTTLHNRINGHLSHKKGAQNLQKIAPVQERALADWTTIGHQGTMHDIKVTVRHQVPFGKERLIT